MLGTFDILPPTSQGRQEFSSIGGRGTSTKNLGHVVPGSIVAVDFSRVCSPWLNKFRSVALLDIIRSTGPMVREPCLNGSDGPP